MKIQQRYEYTYEAYTVEVEVKITGDHEVELEDIYGIKDASGAYVEPAKSEIVEMETAIEAHLEAESDACEWDDVIIETRADAEEDEPEPTWGYAAWAPRVFAMPIGCRT